MGTGISHCELWSCCSSVPFCMHTGDHSVYIPVYTELQNKDNTKQNKSVKGQNHKFPCPRNMKHHHTSKNFLVKKKVIISSIFSNLFSVAKFLFKQKHLLKENVSHIEKGMFYSMINLLAARVAHASSVFLFLIKRPHGF